jgi:hypothetical protein
MKSRSSSPTLSKVEIKKLSSELSKLVVEHATAIRDATILGLKEKQSAEMVRRRKRMNEICKQLGKVASKVTPKTGLFPV